MAFADDESAPKRSGQLKRGVDYVTPGAKGPVGASAFSAPAGAHLTYYGGKIVAHPVYYTVLWATGSVQTYGSDINIFLQDMGTMGANMMREYSTAGLAAPTSNQTIGVGTFGGTYTLTPASNATTVSDATIQTQLQAWITTGKLPAPQHDPDGSTNTIFVLMFPHGTTITQGGSNSCQAGGFCAYHGTIRTAASGEYFYIVMPDQQAGSGCDTGCGSASTNEGNYTSVLSHEIYETITDAEVGLATTTGPPLAWYDNTNGEIGDICNAQQGTATGPSGRTWTMQLWFSNAQNNCVIGSTATAAQTITFAALPNKVLGSAPFNVSATASSGLAVTFSGGTAGVCTVTSAGLVTLTNTGTCSVTANQGGGTSNGVTYSAAAPVVRTFLVTATVGTTPQTISFPSIPNKALGIAPFAITATATSGLAVSFASLTTATCTVSASAVTLVAAGQCSIQATQAGNATFAAAPPVTNNFQIAPGGSGITNGGFEAGSLTGWTVTGTTSVVGTGAHGGTYAARLGATTPTNGDSTIAQTFTAPGNATGLSFYYKMTCPDTVAYDWATATLKDTTAGTTVTVLPKTCANNSAWVQVTASLTGGHNYTITLVSHDDNYAGDPTYTLYDDVTITTGSTGGGGSGLTNGGFESGLTGWTTAGTAAIVATGAHGGTNAARLGATTATNGDSSLSQTFTAPTGATKLSFFYKMTCPDTVTYDWATATLKDVTAGTTVTVLPKTCATNATWVQSTTAVTAGHNYTITLVSHDDNYASDPSYTLFDDVVVQ